MLKEVTMKEIEAIFAVTDRLELSRELLVIPLVPRAAGGVRQTAAGKLEIVVPAEGEFGDFVEGLEGEIKKVTGG
jgi:hypothetical protein